MYIIYNRMYRKKKETHLHLSPLQSLFKIVEKLVNYFYCFSSLFKIFHVSSGYNKNTKQYFEKKKGTKLSLQLKYY